VRFLFFLGRASLPSNAFGRYEDVRHGPGGTQVRDSTLGHSVLGVPKIASQRGGAKVPNCSGVWVVIRAFRDR